MRHAWVIFGKPYEVLAAGFVNKELKELFVPFPKKFWEDCGEQVIVSNSSDGTQMQLLLGYDEAGGLAISIEGKNKSAKPRTWGYCADPEKIGQSEVFFTKNNVFFPKMSIVTPALALKIVAEFLASPTELPNSISWTDSSDIEWPEVF